MVNTKETTKQLNTHTKSSFTKTKARLGTIILFLLLTLHKPSLVFASENNIVMEPPFQEVVLEEGVNEKTAKIKITNNTQTELNFYFQILEIKQIDEQGNIGFINRPQTAENPLAWFIEEPKNITVPSSSSTDLELKIKNSIDLSPGGHYVALVAKTNVTKEEKQTQISPAISSFLLVKKSGGEVYQLSLKNLDNMSWYKSYLPTTFSLTFENQGNTHTTPRGVIEIKDIFGRLIKKGIVNEGSSIILPGARRTIETKTYEVAKNYPIMLNTVTVKGSTSPGNVPFQQNTSFVYIANYSYLLIILVAVLVAFLVKKYANKKRK